MARIIKIFFLYIALEIPVFHVFSQEKSDFSGWFTADVIISPGNWDFTGSLELRTKENISKVDLLSAAIYGRYRFYPLLKPSAGYESFLWNTGNGTFVEHRLLVQNESTIPFRSFKFENRLSLLNDFKTIDHPNWGVRDRIRVRYRVKTFEPHVSVELYYRLKDRGIHSYKNRYMAGTTCYINSKNTLNLYYMNEHYMTKTFVNHILGVYYCFYAK